MSIRQWTKSHRAVVGAALSWVLLAGLAAATGCARSPTVVLTTIRTDETVAPVLLLRALFVSETDPSRQASSSFASLANGDAANGRGPYHFPLSLSLSVPAALAGKVTITIDGLDGDTGKAIARGMNVAEVIAEQQTSAEVTLTAVTPAGDDGGSGDAVGDGGDPDAQPNSAPSDAI